VKQLFVALTYRILYCYFLSYFCPIELSYPTSSASQQLNRNHLFLPLFSTWWWDKKNRNYPISHVYVKKIKLTYCCFKYSPSICNSWIDHMIFYLFFGSVRFISAHLTSFSPFLLSVASLIWLSSSFYHVVSCLFTIELRWVRCLRFIFWHHHHRPPSPYRLTLTLHCYKKVVSTLVISSTFNCVSILSPL
jgi:hypothetical protein